MKLIPDTQKLSLMPGYETNPHTQKLSLMHGHGHGGARDGGCNGDAAVGTGATTGTGTQERAAASGTGASVRMNREALA